LLDGTRTDNGTSGGTFRRTGGVQVAERRLRLILGLPINDGELIRPLDEPVLARAVFDWPSTTAEALMRRSELRRQRQIVRRRELELIASRNFLLPRFDAVSRYRWRGFGNDLISATGGKPRFNNAWQDLLSGDFQEFQFGFELDVPIGFRRAHAGVQHAELRLARERAILAEQERQIVHDLSNAVAEVDRTYAAAKLAFNQRTAAREQFAAVQAAFEGDKATADQVLDAQRRLAEDESGYFLALVEYALAVKNVHFEKGALLDYNQIILAEDQWPAPGDDLSPLQEIPPPRVRQTELNYQSNAAKAKSILRPQAEAALSSNSNAEPSSTDSVQPASFTESSSKLSPPQLQRLPAVE
jgi:outer membrane protein TolC